MRVFISYASEQRDLAERLALGLRSIGNKPFYDRDALAAGESFDNEIRRAVQRAHLFVFLISRESLQEGSYPMTELALARQRWPHPAGKVLPVLVEEVPVQALPPYLRSVSVLEPEGDLVADVMDAVQRLAKKRAVTLGKRLILLSFALLLTFGLWTWCSSLDRQTFVQNSEMVSVPGVPEGASDQFHFDLTLNNPSPEAITIVDILPESEPGDLFTGTSFEWLSLNRNETKNVSLVTELRQDVQVPSFQWRICLGYVLCYSVQVAPPAGARLNPARAAARSPRAQAPAV